MFKVFLLIGTLPEFRFFNLGFGYYSQLSCALVKMLIKDN